MKMLLTFLAISVFTPGTENALIHRLIVQPSSALNIEGMTNINKFKCAISGYAGKDTLVLHEGGRNTRPVFVKGAVELDASGFECGMSLMTSDFHKTINSKEHPTIVIDFISFERTPTYAAKAEKFKGIMKISLAGVTKLFEVNCAIEADPSGIIHLIGSRDFTFSDFGLKVPTRMFGAVKVKNNLTVNFHLQLLLDPNS